MRVAGHDLHWESSRLASLGFRVHVALYRLLRGRLVGRNILVLTTVGRRTKRKRATPLHFVLDKDDYVIVASNGGEDRYPGWWHNIQANPDVEIDVGALRLACRARRVTEQPDGEQLFARLCVIYGGYGKYRQRTSRELTIFRLTPASSGSAADTEPSDRP